MPLQEDEIEALARRKMLKNLLDDLYMVVEQREPQLARDLEQVMEEYQTRAASQCMGVNDVDALVECVLEQKQRAEPELKEVIRQRM